MTTSVLFPNIIETAISIAKEANILPSDYEHSVDSTYVMEGSYFSNNCGGLEEGGKKVNNIGQFERCVENLVVVARSTPENKYLLVTGLKELGNVVAVTGCNYQIDLYLFR